MSDPVSKTEFHRKACRKLCEFEEALERENYIEAVAARYNIAMDDLQKTCCRHCCKGGGLTKTVERPKSGIQQKRAPDDGARKNQRLLLTWLTDEPAIFPKVTNG